MDCVQEILMKKQVDYMWEIIRKNGMVLIFFVIVILCFVFLVVLFFWFFTLRNVHLTLLRMGFFGVFLGLTPYNLSHISYNDETLHSHTLLKKDPKIYKSRDTACNFCWYKHFFAENHKILLYQEIQMWTAFWYIISN